MMNFSFWFMEMMLICCEEKKNTEDLVVTSKWIGLEVNAEKSKYMVMSQDEHAGQNHNIKIDNNSFERVEQFEYLGTTMTNKNSIHKKLITICHALFTHVFRVKPNVEGLMWFEFHEDSNEGLLRWFMF